MADEVSNTEVTLSVPTENKQGTLSETFDRDEWIGFCERLHEYAGDEFLSGADADQAIYRKIMTMTGQPELIEALPAVESS